MFSNLSDNLSKIFSKLKSRGVLSESDVMESLREIRIALLEADVALPVVKQVLTQIQEKAIGLDLIKSVSPGQLVIKIVNDELIKLLKSENQSIDFKSSQPLVIMMAGLQGSGKTTTSAKLALRLSKSHNKKVLIASLDTYRPAAQQQLEVLANKINIASLAIISDQSPLDIAQRALSEVSKKSYDVLILDTAGRLHTDQELMAELSAIKKLTKPVEILLVADSLTGQDAVKIAQEFNERLQITGIVLTRVDGDARGGAALSMRLITDKPIKYIGNGEKLSDFEEFHADRIVSQILGMGDIVSLVERTQDVISENEALKLSEKMQKGAFDLNDLYKQLKNIGKMGGVGKLMGMIPGVNKLQNKLSENGFGEKKIKQQLAIIESMTKRERRIPLIINPMRKKRIALGSGTNIEDVNKLLKQYQAMLKVMKQFGRMSPADINKFKNMANVKF